MSHILRPPTVSQNRFSKYELMHMHTHACSGQNKLTPVTFSSPAVTGNMDSGEQDTPLPNWSRCPSPSWQTGFMSGFMILPWV